ncbi:hypothetical protein NP493_176g03009 [Ridgeia piscesae]|uniref:Aminotransferase class I/classII large domain-containing protein n=1 Tax=Ridgeia piscesae TaxID=27915 RepID=A0AAD9UFA6_RIDPI|nr:hypothetical protein NP493_176g03009 [Ridgeia piscesae]
MVTALKEYAGENTYLSVAGIPELRQALCEFHTRYDRLEGLGVDQFIVGPGSKELIFLLMTVFNGDVLVVSPTWTTYRPQSLLAHHAPYVVEASMETEWRVTPEAVEKTIVDNKLTGNKLLIFCNPDNPTRDKLTLVYCYCSVVLKKHNVIVLSDEIYARIHFADQHDTLARYYPEGTIISSGLSKWASAGGWRVGYQIYPVQLESLRLTVKSAASHTYSCVAAPMQYAVAKGLRNVEECDSYMHHTTRIMKAAAEYSYSELTAVGVRCTKSTAGFYLFPDFGLVRESLLKRGIETVGQMCDVMLKEANVALMGGGPAFLRPVTELTTRLCYVNFDGAVALAESQRLGLETPLPTDFVRLHCTRLHDGIQVRIQQSSSYRTHVLQAVPNLELPVCWLLFLFT